jgi:O-acetyl-ADP-ribose deacetylase (regulator of RNase III)
MSRPGARPGGWKTQPFPEAHVELSARRVYSSAEMTRIRDGLLPEEMEDKWFIVWNGEALDLHRSWTGSHIYRVAFAPTLFGERIARAHANRDPSQYTETSAALDERMLLWLIDGLLLERWRNSPASNLTRPRVTLSIGDITRTAADAVVNAANEPLAGGGGVDGAIHRAAGPELMAACRSLPATHGVRCPTGEARVTPGFRMSARWIIHAVGPIHRGVPDDARLLASAIGAALDAAVEHGARTVALPALSCGAFGYPLHEAARIAVAVAREPRDLDEVSFVLFDQQAHDAWQSALRESLGGHGS